MPLFSFSFGEHVHFSTILCKLAGFLRTTLSVPGELEFFKFFSGSLFFFPHVPYIKWRPCIIVFFLFFSCFSFEMATWEKTIKKLAYKNIVRHLKHGKTTWNMGKKIMHG
jgi:hypothetical protein